MMKNSLKLLDAAVFLAIGYFAVGFFNEYYATADVSHALKFDAVYILALTYIMARRPDVNTITLALIILLSRVIDIAVFNYNLNELSGFVYYPLLLISNLVAVAAIWTRPVLFSRLSPWKNNKNFAVTHQDNVLAMLFIFQAGFMFLLLVEHGLRRVNDWMANNFLMLYNAMPAVQLLSTIVLFAILYYMTFDKAKEKRPDR